MIEIGVNHYLTGKFIPIMLALERPCRHSPSDLLWCVACDNCDGSHHYFKDCVDEIFFTIWHQALTCAHVLDELDYHALTLTPTYIQGATHSSLKHLLGTHAGVALTRLFKLMVLEAFTLSRTSLSMFQGDSLQCSNCIHL